MSLMSSDNYYRLRQRQHVVVHTELFKRTLLYSRYMVLYLLLDTVHCMNGLSHDSHTLDFYTGTKRSPKQHWSSVRVVLSENMGHRHGPSSLVRS